jgi:recombination protein RecA
MAKEFDCLADILKDVNKKFGEGVISVGVEDLTSYGTLSLGSPGFDFCLYNSFPERKIVEFCGAEGSGKTTTAYLVAASYIRKELERNPENPRGVLFVDLECGADPEWALKMGYDMNNSPVRTIRFTGSDMPAEYIFDVILNAIKTGEIGLVVLDSLNMLVPLQTFGESLEKKDMGGIAKPLGDFARRVKGLLVKYNATLIGINQLRENIGGYGNPLTTSGGRGWKHACDVRMMFKKSAFIDEDGNELKSTAESPAGYIMEAAVLKTKVCKWDRKLGRMYVNYDRGIDIMQDTIEVAIQFGFIDNSVQGSFKLVDPSTGELMCDEEGKEIKIRGKKNLKPYFEERPHLWRMLYDKVYDKLSQKQDPSIVSFEKMLNINMDEKFNIDLDKESRDE